MFRSGRCPVLFVTCRGSDIHKVVELREPSLNRLRLAVASAFGTSVVLQTMMLTVTREGRTWLVAQDRDTEELGGSGGKEELFVSNSNNNTGDPLPPPLSEFPLSRCDVPCDPPAAGVLVVEQQAAHLQGEEMLKAIKGTGYFKVKLDAETHGLFHSVFECAKRFFNEPDEDKARFLGKCFGRSAGLAHNLGWKRVPTLGKEFFVYREVMPGVMDLPVELATALRHVLMATGTLLREMARAMLKVSGGWDDERIEERTKSMLSPATQTDQIGATSFVEVFRYDCSSTHLENVALPKFRIACGEHRDTGVLTAIPASNLHQGLELFNWSTGKWHLEDAAIEDAEMVVFAGEMAPWFFEDESIAPLCHRVVVPLAPTAASSMRFSCPVELLPEPDLAAREELSRLACGLKSANY